MKGDKGVRGGVGEPGPLGATGSKGDKGFPDHEVIRGCVEIQVKMELMVLTEQKETKECKEKLAKPVIEVGISDLFDYM